MRNRFGSRRAITSVAISAAAIIVTTSIVSASDRFSDVPSGAYYHDDVNAIADANITAGCGGGKYCPNNAVTRGQMAVFLNKLGALGAGTTPVVNADKLDGLNSTAFRLAADPVDAATLDGLDSSDFALASSVPKLRAGTCSIPGPSNSASCTFSTPFPNGSTVFVVVSGIDTSGVEPFTITTWVHQTPTVTGFTVKTSSTPPAAGWFVNYIAIGL